MRRQIIVCSLAAALWLVAGHAAAAVVPAIDPCTQSDADRTRVPGQPAKKSAADNAPCDPTRSPPPPLLQDQPLPALPDRWRIVDSLPGYGGDNILNPYRRNRLKGDMPLYEDWFLALSVVSDTVLEPRRLPTPVGPQSAGSAQLNVFGDGEQILLAENIAVEIAYLRGDTVFRPPDIEFRFAPVININRTAINERRALDINPRAGDSRTDEHLGVQAAFVDLHLRNVSERYDFDSLRIGIQPFNADFRGFLFQDAPFGVRLFGTRDNNIHQYNIAWFRRLEKDTNSGLNDIGTSLRDDDVLVGNYYWQDFLAPGFTVQGSLLYNRNRENGFFYDNNGFLNRPASLGVELPREYDVLYPGLNADGHLGRWNLTLSGYAALGRDTPAVFVNRNADIRAWFGAAEFGFDDDWRRWRFSAVYASGDDDPFDQVEEGFDAVFENPVIAGADTSFWIRQGIPLVGGGGVTLSTRNGLLANLRSSKEHGQSNFTNPGLLLLGVGTDLDLTPQTRLSFNLNHLQFAATEVLEVARAQGGIAEEIGWDLSAAVIWRPLASQNIVCRLSAAALLPGSGYEQLFGDEFAYSVLGNLVLAY